jgi:hypothetical protein
MQLPPLFALRWGRKHALIHVVGQHERERGYEVKTTRIDIEGRRGHYATVSRCEGTRVIEIVVRTPDQAGPMGGGETFNADATNEDSQHYAAALLQKRLDGYQGAAGDVADYLRAIQTFAD